MPAKGKVFTGARARLSIDGVTVGYANNVSGSEQIDYEALRVLGIIRVVEHVPLAYDVSLEMGFFRIVGETLKQKGWFPKVGTTPEEHLTNILTSGELTVTVEDTQTNQILFTYEQAKIASRNFSVDARGVVGERCTFVAITAKDESET